MCLFIFFFFKQKTAYEMRISDWSSDVCSSDLAARALHGFTDARISTAAANIGDCCFDIGVCWIGVFPQEHSRRHDHAWLAKAALRHIFRGPGLLHRMAPVGR